MAQRVAKNVYAREREAAQALPWMQLRESFAVAPAAQTLLQLATGGQDALARNQHRGRTLSRLGYGLALGLVLALGGGYIGYHWLGSGQDVAAWACSEGYALEFIVCDAYDKEFEAGVPGPNAQQLKAEVKQWARAIELPVIEPHAYNGIREIEPDISRYLLYQYENTVAGVAPLLWTNFKLILVGTTDKERDSLVEASRPLSGVLEPACDSYDIYREVSVPQSVLLGCQIKINGKIYDFPADFTHGEAGFINNYLTYWPGEGVKYCAFKPLDLNAKVNTNRLGLGDVYKVEKDATGNLSLTTVEAKWDAGRELLKQPYVGREGGSGFSVEIPPDCPVTGLDPLQALTDRMLYHSKLLEHVEDFQDELFTRTAAIYRLNPPERVLAAGAPKLTQQEVTQAQALAQRMDAVLNKWRAQHSECWDPLYHNWQVRWHLYLKLSTPLWYEVTLTTSKPGLADELLAELAAIPGVPEPQVSVGKPFPRVRYTTNDTIH